MVRSIIITVLCVVLFPGISFGQDVRATTEDGRPVVLKKDGTYKFVSPNRSSLSNHNLSYQKPDKSNAVISLKRDRFQIWYDPSIWQEQDTSNADKPTFVHKDGDIRALIVAERAEISMDTVKEIGISSAKKVAPDARITYEDKRLVNGTKVICVKIVGKTKGLPFVFLSYYYGGKAGVVQQMTYAPANLFAEYESDMLDFLNGLVIKE